MTDTFKQITASILFSIVFVLALLLGLSLLGCDVPDCDDEPEAGDVETEAPLVCCSFAPELSCHASGLYMLCSDVEQVCTFPTGPACEFDGVGWECCS